METFIIVLFLIPSSAIPPCAAYYSGLSSRSIRSQRAKGRCQKPKLCLTVGIMLKIYLSTERFCGGWKKPTWESFMQEKETEAFLFVADLTSLASCSVYPSHHGLNLTHNLIHIQVSSLTLPPTDISKQPFLEYLQTSMR